MPKTTIIHVDIDPSEINKNKKADLAIVADVRTTLQAMVESLVRRAQRNEIQTWQKKFKEVKESCQNEWKVDMTKVTALSLLKKLREILPAASIVTTEVGQCQMWASLHYDVIEPGTFFSSTVSAPWALAFRLLWEQR